MLADGAELTIKNGSQADVARWIEPLTELLHAVVRGGAQLGWEQTFTLQEACTYWQAEVSPALDPQNRILLLAFHQERLVGCVQIERGHFPMARHRAEVLKLMVHPDFQRRGIARALMAQGERFALANGIEVFVLDTRPGQAAETLYENLGYTRTGLIPRAIKSVSGAYQGTVFYFKVLTQ